MFPEFWKLEKIINLKIIQIIQLFHDMLLNSLF